MNVSVIIDKDHFQRIVDRGDFLDYIRLSSNAALVFRDGMIIKKHTNLPQISARIYSHSKILMYEKFFFIVSRFCHFNDNCAARLCQTDTDSVTASFECDRSLAELQEVQYLVDNNRTISFYDTLHALRFTNAYLKTFHPILDYSSLNESSVIWKTFEKRAETDDVDDRQRYTSALAQLKILSTFANEPYKMKDELKCGVMKDLFAASPSKSATPF